MSAVRDWLSTLWSGSYKGVPFYFDKDESEGGRDLIKHEFPHRDDPFIEDMGEAVRHYAGDIYVHGDDADATAARLEEVFATIGPGILVVPARGPVNVRCEHFKRADDKDKRGLIAFQVKFVREGAATALISIPLVGRLVLDAADRVASALAGLFPTALALTNQADHVVSAAVDGVSEAAAALDVARQSWSTDPVVSAQVRDAVSAIVDNAPRMLDRLGASSDDVSAFAASVAKLVPEPASDGPTLLAQTVIAATRTLAAGMPPASAQAAFGAFVDAFASPLYVSPPLATSEALSRQNTLTASQLARLAALTAWAEALSLRTYASRPEGVSARAQAADRFEAELAQATGALNADLYVALENLRGQVVDYLSRVIADLAPVVTVTAARSMPSLYWAWRLYADPARTSELVARNRVRHPSFMPETFAALEPR